ncbi:MAG: DUF4350 domain-containing protein, partial [Luteolibacter sp.]
MKKLLLMVAAALALTACDYKEVVHEIGYKGKARINPWLAAERFCAQSGNKVHSLASWTAPGWEDAVWFLPASILNNESFSRQMEKWVSDGGHLVLLVEHADAETSDWSDPSGELEREPALRRMLERMGITLKDRGTAKKETSGERIEFNGRSFEVDAKSNAAVSQIGGDPGVFASVKNGEGRLTVITDGRIFRNRWIGDKDHAALLDSLIRITDDGGEIAFMRGSNISLWGLLGKHLWPVLIGLGLLTGLWLWKNFSRFGPVEAATEPSLLRGYDHHLESLGDFQWRLDRAVSLLAPMRAQIVERGQRICTRAGRRDDDFF